LKDEQDIGCTFRRPDRDRFRLWYFAPIRLGDHGSRRLWERKNLAEFRRGRGRRRRGLLCLRGGGTSCRQRHHRRERRAAKKDAATRHALVAVCIPG
jgi:hypothetical protein